jgi:hypothetical protein
MGRQFSSRYDSSWSVCRRVCTLNALSFYELAKLIASKGADPNCLSVGDLTDGVWINIGSHT